MLNVNNNEKHTGTHTQRNANKAGKRDKGKRGKASKQAETESTQASTINEYTIISKML